MNSQPIYISIVLIAYIIATALMASSIVGILIIWLIFDDGWMEFGKKLIDKL